MEWIVNLFWRLVFLWKRRTGWIDLHREVEATGTVINLEAPGLDGDGNFDVEIDADQQWMITGFGGRLTFEPGAGRPSIHCEVEPWAPAPLKERFSGLKVGQRVRVRGAWGFDGVHIGVAEWLEVLAALVRHAPNVRDGWFEIHPVASIEVA